MTGSLQTTAILNNDQERFFYWASISGFRDLWVWGLSFGAGGLQGSGESVILREPRVESFCLHPAR